MKERMKTMMGIFNAQGQKVAQAQDDEGLFDCIVEIEKLKFAEKEPDFENLYWNFNIYPPKQAAELYFNCQSSTQEMKEAVEKNLPLIEVYCGDIHNPQYIVLEYSVSLVALKNLWCLDYCQAHNLYIREDAEYDSYSNEM